MSTEVFVAPQEMWLHLLCRKNAVAVNCAVTDETSNQWLYCAVLLTRLSQEGTLKKDKSRPVKSKRSIRKEVNPTGWRIKEYVRGISRNENRHGTRMETAGTCRYMQQRTANNIKVNFTLKQAMKALGESRDVALLFL